MRRIDADMLKSYKEIGHERSLSEKCFSELDVVNMINKQPTAYDIDKVMEQLEVLHDLVRVDQKLAVSQAIEIVKAGEQNG